MSDSIKLIDCDVHHLYASADEWVKRMPAYFRQRGFAGTGGLGLSSPIGVNRSDAAPEGGGPPGSSPARMKQQHLDAFGIDYAILIGGSVLSLGVHPDADYAEAAMRAYNEWQFETWADADPRLRMSILGLPNHPQATADEIRRLGERASVAQVVMCSATRTPLGDRSMWPIYEAACEVGIPVAVHPGAECKGISNCFAPGFPASYFEWHTNLSQNYMGQITSLICRGVFCEFPALTFVALEGGVGWVPHLMWRLDKNWKALRATTPWLQRPPSEYLVEHVRFTTQPIEEPDKSEQLLQIFEMMRAEKTLMFSSDYPHWDGDSPAHGLPKLPQPLHDRIYFENARELYGL